MVWVVFRIFAQLFGPVNGIVCRIYAEVGRLGVSTQVVNDIVQRVRRLPFTSQVFRPHLLNITRKHSLR